MNPRRKYKRRGTGSVSESKDNGSEDEAGSSMSDSEEHELDALDSDLDRDDGETGLDKHERQKYLKRKRRRDGLGSRIAGNSGLSKDEAKQADERVMRHILVNAALIGGWYFFSLSISIVSPARERN
jgi:solute carrier family 35 protein C2